MKIQIITQDGNSNIKSNCEYTIDINSFNSPMSFDMYDINIISLLNPNIWVNKGISHNVIPDIADFKSLKNIIQNSKKSRTVICFPLNYSFLYKFDESFGNYRACIQLKDMINSLCSILENLLPYQTKDTNVLFENTQTECNGKLYEANFYFNFMYAGKPITTSKLSGKSTTIRAEQGVYYTSLNMLNSIDDLHNFLIECGFAHSHPEFPEWLHEYHFFNDSEQYDIIEESNKTINEMNARIDCATTVLYDNLFFKSILSTFGDALVKSVFKILEDMLECDLSDFEDLKNEDFLIKKGNVTFIGEIKGVTSNVKSEHVSQLEVHTQKYNDKLSESGADETVKPLLIINPFRTKPLSERDEVHEAQVSLAKRYGSLIITTHQLLLLYEKFLNGKITRTEIEHILSTKEGLLTSEDF